MSALGVVVITHDSADTIRACLESLRAVDAEVVVVDNASRDETCGEVRRHPGVNLIENTWNLGFAAAANQGVAALSAPYVLLLNPDTQLLGGVDALVQACAQPGVAAASGKLVDSSGEPQVGFQVRRLPGPAALACEILGVNRLWPGNPVNRRYRCLDLDAGCSAWVEQPAGAFLMLQRHAWRALGGFDESFRPLWFEDVDFAKRALDAGYRIAYVPEAAARHCGGGSARRLSTEKREMFWYGNLLKYASKHFCGWGLRAVCAALILGSCLRAAVGVCRSGSLKPVVIYGRVIRLTGKYWLSGPGGTTLLLAVTARK